MRAPDLPRAIPDRAQSSEPLTRPARNQSTGKRGHTYTGTHDDLEGLEGPQAVQHAACGAGVPSTADARRGGPHRPFDMAGVAVAAVRPQMARSSPCTSPYTIHLTNGPEAVGEAGLDGPCAALLPLCPCATSHSRATSQSPAAAMSYLFECPLQGMEGPSGAQPSWSACHTAPAAARCGKWSTSCQGPCTKGKLPSASV